MKRAPSQEAACFSWRSGHVQQGSITSSPLIAASRFEHLSATCIFEWVDDQIIVVRLKDLSRMTIDTWAERSLQIRAALPKGSAAYVALIAGDRLGSFSTPYLRERTRDIAEFRNDLTTYTAVVNATNTTLGKFMRIVSQSLSRLFPTVRLRFFTEREEAVTWLKECAAREQKEQKAKLASTA